MIEADDVVDDFECRSAEQTEWLRHHARQAHTAGTAKVLVVTRVGSDVVVAYYAWSMASISIEDAPTRVRKGAGRYPQPVALLARLGVSIEHEGRGLGAGQTGSCICPQCGQKEVHQRGVPCFERTCPKCGAAMTREQVQ